MGKSTISMTIFNSYVTNYQRVSTQCCAFCMANFAELMPWPNHLLTVAYRCLLLFVPPIKIPVTQWLLPFLGHIPPPSTLSSTTWVLLVIYHIDTMHTFSPSTQCSVTVGYVSIYIYRALVVLTSLKNISQWEGLSHILWKKNVPNHQPEIYIYIHIYVQPFGALGLKKHKTTPAIPSFANYIITKTYKKYLFKKKHVLLL